MYSAVLNATECVPDLDEDFCIVDEYIVELSAWDSIQADNCTLLCPEGGSLTCPAAPGPAPAAAFGALPPPTTAGAAAPAAAVSAAAAVTTVPGDKLQSCVGSSLGSQLLQYAVCAKLWVARHGQPAACSTACAYGQYFLSFQQLCIFGALNRHLACLRQGLPLHSELQLRAVPY